MLEFWIADLTSTERAFDVPGQVGIWQFRQRDDYASLISALKEGQCAPTYYASNAAITHKTAESDFTLATDELIDACLILSFLTAACITPRGSTLASDILFVELGDAFIRPRAIRGFTSLQISKSFSQYFSVGMASIQASMKPRQLRLFLSHWISGLTCFSLEDLFLSIGVQMDIVKQCEIALAGRKLDYFPGMQAASRRYGIRQLTRDYKKMRDDIVHEGRLSGSNFTGKKKIDCANVVADTLNWIDSYVSAVLALGQAPTRWSGRDLAAGLPSLTVAK
jgi:hypothetical protein